MKTEKDLQILLQAIDHKGYPAYKDTKGNYQFANYVFSIDRVQGDPFASPSDVSILIAGKNAGFPAENYDTDEKRIALQDYLLRSFGKKLMTASHVAKGSGKSGLITISRPGQEVLERSACQINAKNGDLTIQFAIGFPANGRTINSRELAKVIFDLLPDCIDKTCFYRKYETEKQRETEQVRALAQDQCALRKLLKSQGLVAFVANGSILPRESGANDRPMKNAVKFISPKSMEVSFHLPNFGEIRGMGIKKGITLIVGGGYHGKSTLLKALERGVYNHIANDGREFVLTEESAVKSRAEDGRSIHNVDISMFIGTLPNQKDTINFSTEDASGSTSQAAGLVEAIESGAKLLLMDEDTSATNFMIRDDLMKQVVHGEKEPIIPFIDRVAELYHQYDVSTVLVAGSSGAFFYVADQIIQMDCYKPEEITKKAKEIAEKYKVSEPSFLPQKTFLHQTERFLLHGKEFENPRLKLRIQGTDGFSIDHEQVDLRLLEQLVDEEQTAALAQILKYLHLNLIGNQRSFTETVDLVEKVMQEKGINAIAQRGIARPRRQEIFACINRYRKQNIKQKSILV